MNWRAFGETFITLLVVMDPIGNAPIFVSLTSKRTAKQRRIAAIQAVLAAGALVAGFALFGRVVIDYLNVSVESLTIAGGLLLLLVALEMLGHQKGLFDEEAPNIALVPLATPLLAGPGAIATVMVLSRRFGAADRVEVILGIAAVVVVVGLSLVLATQIARLLRPAAVHFLTRVFGLLLSAIAVQLVVDAVTAIVRRS